MSDQAPVRYDNYPTSEPRHAWLPSVPEPPGPNDPIPPRKDRRGLLGMLLGLAVGGGVVGSLMIGRGAPAPEDVPVSAAPTPASSSAASVPTPWPTVGPPTATDQRVTVGSHSAVVPAGWTIERNDANEVVLRRGSNWVNAYAFTAEAGDRASKLVGPLTDQRRFGVVGKLHVTDSYAMDVGEYVSVAGRGKLGRTTAKYSAVLWIDGFFGWSESEALLIVKVVTAVSGSDEANQADDTSKQFAYDLAITGLG